MAAVCNISTWTAVTGNPQSKLTSWTCQNRSSPGSSGKDPASINNTENKPGRYKMPTLWTSTNNYSQTHANMHTNTSQTHGKVLEV